MEVKRSLKRLCDYGCNQEAQYYFKIVDKWCCSVVCQKCPTQRIKMARAIKKVNTRPEYKKAISAAQKRRYSDPDQRNKTAIATKKAMNTDEMRRKMIKIYKDPARRKKMSKAIKIAIARPEVREKKSRSMKLVHTLPGYKEKCSKSISAAMADPEYRIKISCIQQGISRKEWTGFASKNSYCDAWNDKEYKRDIKNRDGNSCQNINCRRSGNRIVIHHINYNKKDCCPTNLITICNSCNSIANFNREYWESYYKSIVDNIYHQQSYNNS